MAKGQLAKEEIAKKILATFDGSFKYDKEIRVPIMENGELVQVKITLTAAKTNVEAGGDTAAPTEAAVATPTSTEITEDERKEVVDLVTRLGL